MNAVTVSMAAPSSAHTMTMVREFFPMPLLLVGASTPVEEGLPSRPGSAEVESPLRAGVLVCAHDEHDDGPGDERESPVEIEVPGRVVDIDNSLEGLTGSGVPSSLQKS